ncbi:MAG: chorismate synthase [Ignavibacteria bacterium]|nr:chorismate synthase [Ignavibacteria bacterium]
MAGNIFGNLFRVITFGESHGPVVGVVIDGIQPNLLIDVSEIQKDLDKRKPGQSKVTSRRKESDKVQVVSGIFEGKTTGTPLCMLIRNEDTRAKDYSDLKEVFRPGHAGYTFLKKYGIYDYQGGGRASGRETVSRVAAGAIAKQLLNSRGIKIVAYTKKISSVEINDFVEEEINKNIVRSPDKLAAEKMIELIDEARKDGDSLGGIVEIRVSGLKAGFGEPVFDKIDADLSNALMSIGAVKGFEVGSGFKSAEMRGSECNDQFMFNPETKEIETITNNSGGILGGITSGSELNFRIAVKPTSSISKKQRSVTTSGEEVEIQIGGRHDPCICPRIVPVAEAMTALVLIDHILMQERIVTGRENLDEKRNELDLIDRQILLLIHAREDLVREVAKVKNINGFDIEDEGREKRVYKNWISAAQELSLDKELIEKIMKLILERSKFIQTKG